MPCHICFKLLASAGSIADTHSTPNQPLECLFFSLCCYLLCTCFQNLLVVWCVSRIYIYIYVMLFLAFVAFILAPSLTGYLKDFDLHFRSFVYQQNEMKTESCGRHLRHISDKWGTWRRLGRGSCQEWLTGGKSKEINIYHCRSWGCVKISLNLSSLPVLFAGTIDSDCMFASTHARRVCASNVAPGKAP
jgi:hypothetical protein